MNKDFFASHRERPPGTYLRAVLDDQGILETHPDRILEIASTYYEDLFTADPLRYRLLEILFGHILDAQLLQT